MDLSVLLTNRRSAAAQFVYATCMEEMGKALILFDWFEQIVDKTGGSNYCARRSTII